MVKKLFFSLLIINLLGVLNTYAMDVNITPSSGTWYNNSNESVYTSNATTRYIGGEPFFQFSSSNINSQFMSTDVYFNEDINSYLLSNRWDVSFTILSYGDYNIRLGTSSCFITSSTTMTDMDSDSSGDFDVSNSYYSYKNVFCPNVQLNSVPVKLRLYRTFSTGDLNMNRLLITQYWSFSQTNNTSSNQDVIDNQNQNTQDVIDNQNQNTQDVIDNQNSNTEKEIESQQVCSIIDKNNNIKTGYRLDSNGVEISFNENYGITDFIKVSNSSIEVLTGRNATSSHYCFYDLNKTKISCATLSTLIAGENLSIPTNAVYFRSSLNLLANEPTYKLCSNGNQALTDSITSEDSPNTSIELGNLDGSTASDTPISDLITMPLILINVFINGIGNSCSPVNLGNLYGTDLILPCINLEQRLGSDLWSTIDILFSIFMCYNIGMLFVTAFSGITSLRDDFDSLYQPKHADTGYQPKHGG